MNPTEKAMTSEAQNVTETPEKPVEPVTPPEPTEEPETEPAGE